MTLGFVFTSFSLFPPDGSSALEQRLPLLYSGQTLAASTLCTAVIALAVGIGIGIAVTKKYGKGTHGGATVHPASGSGTPEDPNAAGRTDKQNFDDDSDFYGKTVALKRSVRHSARWPHLDLNSFQPVFFWTNSNA